MAAHSRIQGRERFRRRITLIASDPEIWRTIDVDGSLRLDELHDAIQLAMGWRDAHLHEFGEIDPLQRGRNVPQIGRLPRRWMPEYELADASDGLEFGGREEQLIDEHDADVASVFEVFDGPLFYIYDFGDDWMHRIDLIERERVDRPGVSEPPWARRVELVAGERRAPLEDSGGMHGYGELLERLADTDHPDHADAVSWTAMVAWPAASVEPGAAGRGAAFDPALFDPAPFDPALFDPAAFDRAAVDAELALRFELPSDMSGLRVGGDDPVDAAAPIVELLEQLPASMRSELRLRLRSTGALDPVVIEADVAARMVRPFAWLCGRVGADGLTLTKAGWMPPAVVREGMTELGWLEDWMGTSNREDTTPPMRHLRAAARRYGLVRVAKGRLLRTAAGTRLQDDPVGLWRHLATAAVERSGSDAARLASILLAIEIACGTRGEFTGFGRAVASGLGALGWTQANGMPLVPYDGVDLMRPAWHVLRDLGAFEQGERTRYRFVEEPTPAGRAFARAMLGVR